MPLKAKNREMGKKRPFCNSRFHRNSLEATLYVCKSKKLQTSFSKIFVDFKFYRVQAS
jgi:hypothetical protein